jgi:cell division protease FtsH
VVEVTVQGEEIRGILHVPVTRIAEGDTTRMTEFVTFLPTFPDDEILDLLEANNVEVRTRPEADTSWLQIVIFGVLPLLVIGAFFLMYFRRMSGQAQSLFRVGKSKAKLYEEREEATTFDDVAGAKGAKQELEEVVKFLEDSEQFQALGAEIPKGVLLVGPPGTGKTLLARAVAGEADAPFFIITGSDFMEMFVGVGAKRVRDLFEKAKKAAPAIIFIDELDSIGRHRGAGLGGGHDEREQTLNQLLSELDGFEPNENVIVMAATNRPDILDPALLRPGRFDRRITVNLPSLKEREEILRIHAKNKPLHPDVDLEPIAKGTPGFSGADLENLLNEAALRAARNERDQVTGEDLEEARDRIMMGLEREGLALTDEETRLLAYHEAGHALVAAVLPNTDPIHKVTIVPRGRSMGSTHQLPEEERYLFRREYLLDRLAVSLGGRAAEMLVFDTSTSGAEDDLKQATKLARRMVLQWGMSEEVGPFAPAGKDEEVFLGEELTRRQEFSEDTARKVDREVQRFMAEAQERARSTLEDHRNDLDGVAELLLEREEITGEEVLEVLEGDEDGSEEGNTEKKDRSSGS